MYMLWYFVNISLLLFVLISLVSPAMSDGMIVVLVREMVHIFQCLHAFAVVSC